GVMAADVVEGAQETVFGANDNERLTRELGGEKLADVADLIKPANHLPAPAEDAGTLEFGDARVEIPGGGDGRGFFETVVWIIEVQNVSRAALHGAPRASDSGAETIEKRKSPPSINQFQRELYLTRVAGSVADFAEAAAEYRVCGQTEIHDIEN